MVELHLLLPDDALLQHLLHAAGVLSHLSSGSSQRTPKQCQGHPEGNRHRQPNQSQARAHPHQNRGGEGRHQQVRDHVHQDGGVKDLQRLHVVLHHRHDPTRLSSVEERHRKQVQMMKQVAPQIGRRRLPHPGEQIPPRQRERARQHGRPHRQISDEVQCLQPRLGGSRTRPEDIVHQVLDYHGPDEPAGRHHQRAGEGRHLPAPVGDHISQRSAQRPHSLLVRSASSSSNSRE